MKRAPEPPPVDALTLERYQDLQLSFPLRSQARRLESRGICLVVRRGVREPRPGEGARELFLRLRRSARRHLTGLNGSWRRG